MRPVVWMTIVIAFATLTIALVAMGLRLRRVRRMLAVERERRRTIAARDTEILSQAGPDPDLGGLAEYTVALPSELA
jgi:hypothetical protein